MKRYKRVVVCIDRLEHDAPMVEYTGGRSRVAESQDVFFVHVSDDSRPEAPTAAPITTEVLQSFVQQHFVGHGKENLHCEVIQGSPLLETLRFAHDKDVDLIIMGRGFGKKGDGDNEAVLPRRITRKATCSVLVLPEEYKPQADEIVVPVRDSECSAKAVEVACDIASVTGARVIALNIYHVGPSRTGLAPEEREAKIAAAAGREVERVLSRAHTHGVDVVRKCVQDVRGSPVPAILEVLGSGAAKAVVIGARGRSGAAGVLLGNVTEQLIRQSPSPVLAVKKKGECLGVLQALLALACEG
jgi:nucleotide-binding universal stress UspA family protein